MRATLLPFDIQFVHAVKPTDLRAILQYIPRFRDRIFVISADGAVVSDENFANILTDIAVLRSLSIRVVLVHGAAAQIRQLSAEFNSPASDLDGTGVTDAATLRLALMAANRLTHEVLEGLSANDIRAATTNAIVAHPVGILSGVNHQFTGKVERVDVPLLQTLLSQGVLPVVPPLGFDGDGHTYRVNSDGVAVAVAEALGATKLIFVTTSDGLSRQGQLVRQILASDLDRWLAQAKQELPAELQSKAVHAALACRSGIPRVHIVNGRVDEALLAEVFSNEGVGSLIYANEYQQIRRALKKDIRHIFMLTKRSMDTQELVKRTRASIEKQIQDFYIFEIDRNPVACIALHAYPEYGKGELACLYVQPSHENLGIGRKLVRFIEDKALELGLTELVTLSTQAFTYFQLKGGYSEGSTENLPPARREKYEQSGRNSKILVKKLSKPSASEVHRTVA